MGAALTNSKPFVAAGMPTMTKPVSDKSPPEHTGAALKNSKPFVEAGPATTTKPVGYKNPPEHTRFKKGQSGNPRGRAKGQCNLKTDLDAEMREVIQVNEGGAPRRMTKQRAFVKGLMARAIGGDGRAATLLLNLIFRLRDPQAEAPAEVPLVAEDEALLEEYLNRGRARKEDRP
jgi:hypothetical protein